MEQFITISENEKSLFSEIDVSIYFRIHTCNRNDLFEQLMTDIGNFDFNN